MDAVAVTYPHRPVPGISSHGHSWQLAAVAAVSSELRHESARRCARRFPLKAVLGQWRRRAVATGLPLIWCLLLMLTQQKAQAGMAQQYLPLQVGNSWTYVGEDQSTKSLASLPRSSSTGAVTS